MRCGAYPSRDEIWDDEQEGRENNGLKWFEIIGKQGAILGWGKCSVDGTMYGGQWHSGQSPSDMLKEKPWTAKMMQEFETLCENGDYSATGAQLAEYWVKAAERAIENRAYHNQNDSKFNAVGIGYGNGEIQVWALVKKAHNEAECERVWWYTP